MSKSTDRIEKEMVMRAPRSRVWRAIANPEEFGTWFRAKLEGRFEPGARVRGQNLEPGYEHINMDLVVERVEPEHLLSFRWHPYAIERGVDYSAEPTTTVEFRLEEVPGGTRLTVTETGFQRLPAA